ncbi:hypothetical protein Tco_0299237 [Tanacetum coccineum]
MVFFRLLHSHLKLLSNNDLKGTRTEYGFKQAFATLFGQDVETFTCTMFLNMDQLEKQLDNEEFQEIESMDAFKVLEIQFQTFIKSRIYLDDEYTDADNRGKVDTSKALDASLVNTDSSETESRKRDTSSNSGNDVNADDVDIKPVYDENPMDEHYKELSDSIKTTRAKTIEHTTSLIAKNTKFKAQLQEKGFAIATLKNELRKLKGNSVDTKFAKPSILGKPVLLSLRNQSFVRQPTAFKFERPRISKPRFASQVDMNNYLSKPVTAHYLPKEREYAFAKPHHVIASIESRNGSKNMPRLSSNNMVHNHYLDKAKKKTQERGRNSRPSQPSARSQRTANGSKPKPRINNQKFRNWPASKSSCVTTKTVQIAEHSRNSRNFSDSKHFVCSTCQKCVFYANHDTCVTKFMNEVNSRAKSSSKLVLKVVPPADKTATSQQELELLFSPMYEEYFNAGNRSVSKSYALSDNSKQQDKQPTTNVQLTLEPIIPPLNNSVEDNMYKRRCCNLILEESDSLPHAHTQATKTYYKHPDSRIKKAQVLSTKTSAKSDIQDLPLRYQVYQGRLLARFQNDAKYEHFGLDTRS